MDPEEATAGTRFSNGTVLAFLDRAERQDIAVLVSRGDRRSDTQSCCYANSAASRLLVQSLSELTASSIGPTTVAGVPFMGEPSSSAVIDGIHRRCGRLCFADRSSVRIAHVWASHRLEGYVYGVHLLRRDDYAGNAAPVLLDDELRFRRLMDSAPDGILVMRGHRFVYANCAMARLHGYTQPDQLLRLPLEQLICGEDIPKVKECLTHLGRFGNSPEVLELRGLRCDGSFYPGEGVAVAIEWDHAPAVLVTVRDLSGRRLHQSQLAHSDRLGAVGTMAAGVAHEINNPLAYVLLNLEYLLREVPKLAQPYERTGHLLDRLREARHGAERVAAIVGDLKTFSKSNEEQIGPIDLRQVLSGAVKICRSQLGRCGTLVEDYEDIPCALGDASRLEQVFLNLLINAVQALPSDRSLDNRILVRTGLDRRGSSGGVTVEITDTGIGIAPEHVDRVFDPFFTTKPVGTGTGLGLPICHSIVTKMGGSIIVRSELGKGSSFVVSLPMACDKTARSTIPPSLTSFVRCTRRASILIVDDEPAVATTLSRLLSEEHDVVVATCGKQALDCLEERAFDVVLCDLLMPEMSGMELYAEVRRRSAGQADRMAFMSCGAFSPRAAQFLSQVQNERIDKPFDLPAVRNLVERILGQVCSA